MKMNKWIGLAALSLMIILISACGQKSDSDIPMQLTLVALQQTQTALAPQQTAEPTVQPTETKVVVEPTPTINPTPCNLSRMIGETIPDETAFEAGDVFTKSWTLRNDGTCDWTTGYKFVFVDGDRLGGASSQNLPSRIKPGETITLSVNLTAPDDDGEYKGIWRMKSANGATFGNYWFDIYVGDPPAAFAVTSVSLYMASTSIDISCPNKVSVSAEITSNAAGTVTYKWSDSVGNSSSTKSYTFDKAGKKTVAYDVNATVSGSYWAKLYIDNPNHQTFGPINFTVNCTP